MRRQKRARTPPNVPLRLSKKRKVSLDHCYEGTGDINIPNTSDMSHVSSPDVSTCVYTVDDLQNEHMYARNDNLVKKFDEPRNLESVLSEISLEMDKLKQERDFYYHAYSKAQSRISILENENKELRANSKFGVHVLKDEKLVKTFTGLPSISVFNFVFEKVEPKLTKLEYYSGKRSLNRSRKKLRPKSRLGPKRQLCSRDEMLLTLMKLRLNPIEDDLAQRFQISRGSVSSILTTWICFLGLELEGLVCWPSPQNILKSYPACFKRFGTVIAILDCFEIQTQRPSVAKANSQIYSSYKSRPTAKVLVACSPCGAIIYISHSAGGATTDKEMVEKGNILDKIEASALQSEQRLAVMADKGFNIQELLLPCGVKLVKPPMLRKKKQFSEVDNVSTKVIANSRIHVERVIGRVKEFKILKHEMPLNYVDLLDHILVICSAVTNLQPRLVKVV